MSRPGPHLVLLGFCILLLAGCATYQPNPDPDAPFIQRAQIKESGKLRVSVAVPTRGEAKAYLGVDVERHKIQPIWVRVENNEDDEFVLLPLSADPDYFSPAEAAWKNHKFLRGEINRKMDFLFDDQQVPILIGPGEIVDGLVYTNWTKGLKYVEIDLRGEKSTHFVHFAIEIPGAKLDYQQVDFEELYPLDEIREVDDAGLEAYLEALPCCALGGDRKTLADPLNIVVVAPQGSLGPPFLRRGWMVTETIRTSTVLGTIASSLFGRVYKNSPVSALYLYDRPQDLALQKARDTVDERNHLRLWLSPIRWNGQLVWVGQISRDIGVRLTRKTITTHKIDPDTDEARFYLVQDLASSSSLARMGYTSGVGGASRYAPRENYTGDPYYTDGLRVVFFLSDDYVDFDEVDWIETWERPRDHIQHRTAPAPEGRD